ncbi:MAG: hypothetical protein KAT69_07835 [Candidatus Aminicenantes bacterium]|nr:hypothetical protein [Candidatus Aminicenantes bacterium]
MNKNIVAQIARRAGINTSHLYQIGRGQKGCSVATAVALEEASKHYARKGNDFMTVEEILNIDGLRLARAEEMEKQDQKKKI